MKYFLVATLSFATFIVLLHWGGQWIPPSADVAWIEGIYERKTAALRSNQPPRVILVGGSEVHYGVSAGMMTGMLGVPTINYGTHAALMWREQIRRVEPYLQTGDIVLFSLNRYTMWRSSINAVLVNYIQQAAPSLVFYYPVHDWPWLVGRDLVRELVRQPGLSRVRKHARARAAKTSEYGDVVSVAAPSPQQQARLLSPPDRKTGYIRPLRTLTGPLRRVKRFAERMKQDGIAVLLFWPAILDMKGSRSAESLAIYQGWNERLRAEGLVVLNKPEDLLLPVEMMGDSVNHPNDAGRAIATRSLVQELKRYCRSNDINERHAGTPGRWCGRVPKRATAGANRRAGSRSSGLSSKTSGVH